MNTVHLVSGCTCVLCGTWRRIGNLLTRSPPVEAFHTFALRRLRELYTELLDAAESCTVVGAPPVAAGQSPGGLGEEGQALPKIPPGTPPPGVCGTETALPRAGESADSRSREVGPNEATAKAPPAKPSVEGAPAASGEAADATEKKDKPKKEKKTKKDKKRRKPSRPSPEGVRRSPEVKAEKPASESQVGVKNKAEVWAPVRDHGPALLGQGQPQRKRRSVESDQIAGTGGKRSLSPERGRIAGGEQERPEEVEEGR